MSLGRLLAARSTFAYWKLLSASTMPVKMTVARLRSSPAAEPLLAAPEFEPERQ